MRKILFLFLFVAVNAFAQKDIVVLHSNDCHSQIFPFSKNLADKKKANLGGFARRVAYVKQQRKLTPNLLLFDCGDFSQGSSYYSLFKGEVEIGLMNIMGYDAATIGNHEFDFGLDNMIRLFKMAEFPVVCSNYDFADTELKDIVKPYLVLKRQGVRIGVFALCPPLEGLVSRKNYGPLKFLDPVEVTDRMVDVLRNREKCDVVICLSHLGWEVSDYPDNELIKRTSGIDLILGGHSHTYLETLGYETDKTGRQVPVDHEGKHAVFVGKIQLTLEKK